MLSELKPSLRLLLVMTVLTGLAYPLAVTGLAQALFPVQANGSQVELLVPHDRYDVVARLQRVGRIHKEEHREEGVALLVQYPPAQSGFFAPFLVAKT